MNKAEVKRIIEQHGLHPNKRLGQNFLVSEEMSNRIIEAINITAEDQVLEIGPGLGALTEKMIDRANRLTVIEIDSGYSRLLGERFGASNKFKLIHADFLKNQPDDSFTIIVSNLPYYCSTEILFNITRYKTSRVFVMLQKELADRIVASPGDKSYGALSITLGFYYIPEILFKVSRESFYPKPEVTSAFMLFSRHDSLLLDHGKIELFHNIVKSAFWGRRKTILTAISESPHLDIDRRMVMRILDEAGIDGQKRGEELSRDQFITLTKVFSKNKPP